MPQQIPENLDFVGRGRHPLLLRLHERLTEEMAREDTAARRLVTAAEEESARTCESCGAPGRTRHGSWLKTLCDACAGPGPTGRMAR